MKTLLVVPVYNGEPIVHQVVKDLLAQSTLDLLVVDDGSEPPLQFSSQPRLTCLRQPRNQGKGIALRRAMAWAQKNGYSHILTFDGDGQHRPADVEKMLAASQNNPQAIVIGAREFDSSVPGVSRFGRKFSNFWVRYQTGVRVSDSQSGLRLYPLDKLASLTFFTRRYDFEIEILVRGLWRNIPVIDVAVGVIYAPADQRISHFNKLWDNLRITILNVFLIAYSLIFYQRGLLKVILAGVLAFLASLIPGLLASLLLGLLACVLFKVNVVAFLIAFLVLHST